MARLNHFPDSDDLTMSEVRRVSEGNVVALEKILADNVSVKLTFTVKDKGGSTISAPTFVLKNAAGDTMTPDSGSIYTVPFGAYTYSVSKTEFIGVEDLEVYADKDRTVAVVLDNVYYDIVFDVNDSVSGDPVVAEDLTIVVKSGATPVNPVSPGVYKLIAGSYTYNVSATGYTTQSAVALTVSASDTEVVALVAS